MLSELKDSLAARGIRLLIGNLRTRVRHEWARGWVGSDILEEMFHPSVDAALLSNDVAAAKHQEQ
jgi:hypothetical protein